MVRREPLFTVEPSLPSPCDVWRVFSVTGEFEAGQRSLGQDGEQGLAELGTEVEEVEEGRWSAHHGVHDDVDHGVPHDGALGHL